MDQLVSIAAANAQASYQSYLDSVTQAFVTNYITECMDLNETFNVKAPYNEHHFTLYYYDQAGNLVKTIPPRGVDTLSVSERAAVEAHRSNPASPAKYPKHVDSTRYWYNTLNKPIKQSTIDGGITQFWYDRIGRLVVSQNAKQEPDDLYSYTLYDDLGRINEVGQLKQNHVMITDTSINPIKLSLWIANGTEREQVTRTFYDEPITTIPDFSQDNLRNRVATVTFQEVYDTDEEVYNHASHYSYDIAGNVKTLVQDIVELEDYVQRFKRIDYEYDLISGKVNKVHYEKDSVDQFIHQYAYDEENRLIQAKTSADGLLWDIDADYQYYAHGPLARIELGERQVQGIDYAYTLQGWLKGINGLDLNLYRDMGRDGNTGASANKKIGRDVYGMVIGYFEDDYYPAGGNSRNFEPSYSPSSFSSASPSLYNGNIRNIGYTIKGLTPLTIGYAYKYDQLNRLAEVKPYDTFNSSNYKWTTSGSGMTSYKEELSYDANGNILTYLRKGAPLQVNMDNMTYNYVAGTNKLVQVEDAVSASNYSIDIDQQVSTNYLYDNSGNLIKDKKEKLDITWTAYGKVDSIYNDNTDLAINFGYDASQNRLSKRVITTASSDTVTSYYIRDAQGNIMAIYELQDDTVRWIEQDLYGSSRLGVLNPDSVVYPPTTYSQFFHHLQGKKQYELTNHLGNVLTTINDRKIGKDTTADGTYDYWLAAQISGQDYYSGGMVMPERSFSYQNYEFGFNGKLKDDEVKGIGNSYDFGARIYDSRLDRWLSVDPLQQEYPGISPFAFALNTPIQALDPDGRLVIFVNGFMPKQWAQEGNHPSGAYTGEPLYRPYPTYEFSTGNQPTYLGEGFSYWDGVDDMFMDRFVDHKSVYVNGSDERTSEATDRYNAGMVTGQQLIQQILSGNITLATDETIKIVGHSQGAAHSAGMAYVLDEAYHNGIIKNPVEQIYFLAPHQPTEFNTPDGIFSVQYSRKSDQVSSKGLISSEFVSGGSEFGRIPSVSEFQPLRDITGNRGGHNVGTFKEIFATKEGEFGSVRRSLSDMKKEIGE